MTIHAKFFTEEAGVGSEHTVRIRDIDSKPDETVVWEALTDGRAYVYFETHLDATRADVVFAAAGAWIEENEG